MTRPGILLFCCLAWFQLLPAVAQPLCRIREFTTRDGLAQRTVSDILQDREGYLWFSTWNGISRFDNYSLVSYRGSRESSYPLTNSRINYMVESITGNIWCGTNDYRAFLFERETENYIDVLAATEQEMKQRYTVRRIVSLNKGVTWIVCDGGICFRIDDRRYREKDGILSFSTFDRSLKGETIYHILEDENGDEWILTDKGITVVGQKEISENHPFVFAGMMEQAILLLSQDGIIARYHYGQQELEFPDTGLPPVEINTFAGYTGNQFIIGTPNGIYLYNASSETVRHYPIAGGGNPSQDVTHVYTDSGGFIWVFTVAPGVTRLDPSSGRIQYFVTDEKEVQEAQAEHVCFVSEDPNGTIWVLPRSGILGYYDPLTERLEKFTVGFGEKKQVYTPAIRKHFQDRQGNFWLSTQSGITGITFLKEHISYQDVDHGSEVRAFFRDSESRFWTGTKSGMVKVSSSAGTVAGYLTRQGTLSSQESHLVRSGIYSIAEDHQNNIWIGTRGDGLFRFTPSSRPGKYEVEQWKTDPADVYSLNCNDIYSICPDSRGNIWIGTFKGGLNLVEDYADGIRFIHSGNQLKGYPKTEFTDIRCITESSDQTLMVGTTYGLVTFSGDFEKPEAIRFYLNRSDTNDPSGLSGNNIMHVYQSTGRQIYVVTFDGGFQPIAGGSLLSDSIRFVRFDDARSLVAPNRALSVFEDEQGMLWIVCEDRLTRFDPESGHFEPFERDYLMRDLHFTEAIPAQNSEGYYTIACEAGMMLFSPEKMVKSNYNPPIVFTGIEIPGSDSVFRDEQQGIVLSKDQRNLSIRFAALDYTDASAIRYAYRMAGLDKEWEYADDTRSVNYANLPKGEYVFQVRSTNSDGVWSEQVRELPIRVAPRFSETGWAWLLYGTLLLGSVLLILWITLYIYRLRYQVGMEKQLTDVKLRFFTDIAHELRTPITLISSPVSEVLEHEKLSPTAREYLGVVQSNIARMLRLINEILDFRKIQHRKMKLLVEELDLKTVAERIMDDFSLIADEKSMNFRLSAPDKPVVYWGDREKMEKILFNLLSNAFKFTPSGNSIEIRIEEQTEHVVITVADTGIGINAENLSSLFQRFVSFSAYNSVQPSSGIGLSLVKELAELHHAEVRVTSDEGRGSEFQVCMRKGRDHFAGDDYVEFILKDSVHPEESPLQFTEDPHAADPESQEDSPLTILVVEDNPELLSFLNSVLSRSYRIITACDGRSGLEKVLKEMPDFILTDIMMPQMDGLEMVRAIKENPDVCHIPIIVLSSKSSLEDRIHGLEYGIDDYITKPFSSSYLKTRVETLIRQRQDLQRRFMTSLSQGPERKLSLDPSEPVIIPFDHTFMERLLEFLEENMCNAQLAVDELAEAMDVSRSILYRKVKTITGCSPIDFIREIRIKRAIQLIETGEFTFSQVAYMTGFNDPKYFGKCFKRQTGMNPTEYKLQTSRPSRLPVDSD